MQLRLRPCFLVAIVLVPYSPKTIHPCNYRPKFVGLGELPYSLRSRAWFQKGAGAFAPGGGQERGDTVLDEADFGNSFSGRT